MSLVSFLLPIWRPLRGCCFLRAYFAQFIDFPHQLRQSYRPPFLQIPRGRSRSPLIGHFRSATRPRMPLGIGAQTISPTVVLTHSVRIRLRAILASPLKYSSLAELILAPSTLGGIPPVREKAIPLFFSGDCAFSHRIQNCRIDSGLFQTNADHTLIFSIAVSRAPIRQLLI